MASAQVAQGSEHPEPGSDQTAQEAEHAEHCSWLESPMSI